MRKITIITACLCMMQAASVGVAAQNFPMTINQVEKIFGLSAIWQEVNYHQVWLPENVDLDSLYMAWIPQVLKSANDYEYYRLLQKFAALMQDANTTVTMPRSMSDSLVSPPVIISEIRGRFYVTNIDGGLAGKLPVGSEITRINGFDIQAYLMNEVLPYIPGSTPHGRMSAALEKLLEGWVNTRLLLNFITPNGRDMNEFIVRSRPRKIQWINGDPPGEQGVKLEWATRDIAVVTVNRFDRESLAPFRQISQQAKAKALIMDLRNNGSDDIAGAAGLVAMLTGSERVVLPGFVMRHYPFRARNLKTEMDPSAYGQMLKDSTLEITPPDTLIFLQRIDTLSIPLVVLAGNKTGKAAEYLLCLLVQHPGRAIIMGASTSGSTGGSVAFPLPGNGMLEVGARADICPGYPGDLRQGIMPDLHVTMDIKSLLNGEDLVLMQAVRYLQASNNECLPRQTLSDP